MANEITYSLSMASSKGGASINTGSISDSVDMAGTDLGTQTSTATTSAALIAAPAAITWASKVRMVVKNLSSAAGEIITIGVDNASPPTQEIAFLDAGEAFITCINAQPYIYGSTTILYQAWFTEA